MLAAMRLSRLSNNRVIQIDPRRQGRTYDPCHADPTYSGQTLSKLADHCHGFEAIVISPAGSCPAVDAICEEAACQGNFEEQGRWSVYCTQYTRSEIGFS